MSSPCSTSAPRPTDAPCSSSQRRTSPGSVLAPSEDVVNALTAAFAKVGAPPGLKFHLAGVVATNVAQQKQSSTTGNKTQGLSILFIIVLLLFVFRSVLAPFVTLLPAAIVLAAVRLAHR